MYSCIFSLVLRQQTTTVPARLGKRRNQMLVDNRALVGTAGLGAFFSRRLTLVFVV